MVIVAEKARQSDGGPAKMSQAVRVLSSNEDSHHSHQSGPDSLTESCHEVAVRGVSSNHSEFGYGCESTIR